MPKIDESRPFIPVRIAVLTVSDTRTPKTTSPATRWPADDQGGRPRIRRARNRQGRRQRRSAKVKPGSTTRSRCRHHHRRHRLHRPRRDAGSRQAVVREGDRRLLDRVSHDLVPEDRHLDDPVARLRRRRPRHLYFLPAGFPGGLQGRLERHPEVAARQPPPSLQFRRDHAAPGRASPPLAHASQPGFHATLTTGSTRRPASGPNLTNSAASSTSESVATSAKRMPWRLARVSARACSVDQRTLPKARGTRRRRRKPTSQ